MLYKLSRRNIVALVFAFIALSLGTYALFAPLASRKPHYVLIDHNDTPDSVYHKVGTAAHTLPMLAFRTMAFVSGYGTRLHTGRYDVGSQASAFSVFRRLRNGSQSAVRLTIPILRTNEDLAEYLGREFQASADDFYMVLTDSTLLAKYNKTPATALCLFLPNTYEIYWDKTPAEILERMHREYRAFWTSARSAQAEAQELTPDEAFTLASIVEQETAYNPEKPQVAGMYLNRLRKAMPLQADPTVKYALGDFALRRIMHHHLKIDSPYNTYRYRGLPPGPICIPSLESLQAVLNAATHSYLYMCAKEDFSGSHNFATTYAEHLRNAEKYTQALDSRGIQ